MGKSASIAQREKENAEFQGLMDTVRRAGAGYLAKMEEDVKQDIREHYENNGWQHARLAGDRKSDYVAYKEWSLDRIQRMADHVVKSIGGGLFPSKDVPGSESADPDVIDEVKKNLDPFTINLGLMAVRIATVLTATLAEFTIENTEEVRYRYKDQPFLGGLHFFLGSCSSLVSASDFFTDQFVSATEIFYEVHFSLEEARTVSLTQIVATLGHEITQWTEMHQEMVEDATAKLLEVFKKDPTKFVTTKKTYDEVLAEVSETIKQAYKKYEEYRTVQRKVETFVRCAVDQVEDPDVPRMTLEDLFQDEHELAIARVFESELAVTAGVER